MPFEVTVITCAAHDLNRTNQNAGGQFAWFQAQSFEFFRRARPLAGVDEDSLAEVRSSAAIFDRLFAGEDPRPFIFIGWLVYAGVYLAFALATTALEAWAYFLCYALFFGLTEPAEKTLVANLVGSERKGLAYGWYNFAIGIATLPSSLIFGALYQFSGPLVAFGWGAVLALVAGIMMIGVKEPRTLAKDGKS
jgi:MFS family permease